MIVIRLIPACAAASSPIMLNLETAFVALVDGSAKPKRAGGSCGAILWKTPGWYVLDAESEYFEDATVNASEYHELMLAVKIAARHNVKNLVICGESRINIQQLRGEIECRTPGLKLCLAQASK